MIRRTPRSTQSRSSAASDGQKRQLYEEDGVICGFTDLWITYEQAQIANLGVKKEYQQKGYGDALLKKCVNQGIKEGCENLTLEVRISNDHAIHVYEKNGFITVNKRKNYYDDGEDAYLMAVSYTYLTLPTISSVQISVVAVSIKK